MLSCPRCGAQAKAGAGFCAECGSPLGSGAVNNQGHMPPPPPYPGPYAPQPGFVPGGHYAPPSIFCPSCNLQLYAGTTHCPRCHLDLVHASSSGMYNPSITDRLRQFLFGNDHRHHQRQDYRHGNQEYYKRRKRDSGDLFEDDDD